MLTKPNFHYINLEIRPKVVKFGTNLDSNVRYFCQEKDYRSLISGEVGLVPKIVRYWSFVIDYSHRGALRAPLATEQHYNPDF